MANNTEVFDSSDSLTSSRPQDIEIVSPSTRLPTDLAIETGGNLEGVRLQTDKLTFTGGDLHVRLANTGITLDVNLDNANDDVLIYGWDGASNVKIKTDAAGELQIDVLSQPALTFGTDSVTTHKGGTWTLDANDGVDIGDVTINNATLAVTQSGAWTVTAAATDFDIRDLTSVSDSVSVLQATHDNLNLNANLQFSDADVTAGNPLPVTIATSAPSTVVNDDQATLAVAAVGETAHETAVTVAALNFNEVWASATGSMKVEVWTYTSAQAIAAVRASGTRYLVGFNSANNPNVAKSFANDINVAVGDSIYLILTNLNNQPQNLYSTAGGFK